VLDLPAVDVAQDVAQLAVRTLRADLLARAAGQERAVVVPGAGRG
jgi:hypothetical protein